MSLLTIVSAFTQRTGLPTPAFVVGSQDSQVIQILGLLAEVLDDLCDRWNWADLTEEAVFTTVAGEDQGLMTAIAPNGFLRVSQDTIYNRTLRLPLYGPVSQTRWQAIKALPVTGPLYQYRIRQRHLLLTPAGIAGHICAFEYASSNAVRDASGVAKQYFTADSDTSLFSDSLLIAGLRWKWKHEKGLDYAEEFRRFEELANNAAGRDGTKPTLRMDGASTAPMPGIFVPVGNWPL